MSNFDLKLCRNEEKAMEIPNIHTFLHAHLHRHNLKLSILRYCADLQDLERNLNLLDLMTLYASILEVGKSFEVY